MQNSKVPVEKWFLASVAIFEGQKPHAFFKKHGGSYETNWNIFKRIRASPELFLKMAEAMKCLPS